jgi:hypothetical protein
METKRIFVPIVIDGKFLTGYETTQLRCAIARDAVRTGLADACLRYADSQDPPKITLY